MGTSAAAIEYAIGAAVCKCASLKAIGLWFRMFRTIKSTVDHARKKRRHVVEGDCTLSFDRVVTMCGKRSHAPGQGGRRATAETLLRRLCAITVGSDNLLENRSGSYFCPPLFKAVSARQNGSRRALKCIAKRKALINADINARFNARKKPKESSVNNSAKALINADTSAAPASSPPSPAPAPFSSPETPPIPSPPSPPIPSSTHARALDVVAKSVSGLFGDDNADEPSRVRMGKQKSIDETIYDVYPRHVGRDKAMPAIANARRKLAQRGELDPASYLLERVQRYADARAAVHAAEPAERQFTPHATTWFNQGRYDDDPEEWSMTHTQLERKGKNNGYRSGTRNSGREFKTDRTIPVVRLGGGADDVDTD